MSGTGTGTVSVGDNVIDLAARRSAKAPPEPLPEPDALPEMYCVRIVRADSFTGEVLGYPDLPPDQQRLIAADLIDLSRSMLRAAFEADGDQNHNLVGEYRVMASGRLTGWTSPQVDTDAKLDWLTAMVCDLVTAVPTVPPGAD
jgi:hypothetical protein